MTTIVYKKSYPAPPVNKREVLRYAGDLGDSPQALSILDECISESEGQLSYKLCYAYYPLTRVKSSLDLGFATVESKSLSRHLDGCDEIILLAATIGVAYDRILARESKISPSKALILDALGTERIEALCDLFCLEEAVWQREKGIILTPRFSVGYGDLPIDLQKSIFLALSCEKNIGLTLGESLLMSPQKSVTAIIGLRRCKNDDI